MEFETESLAADADAASPSVAAPVPTGRFYKSRKARPCDACRRRKVMCHMPAGPPCQRCRGKTQACTFKQGPGQKKRPVHHVPAPTLPPTRASPFFDQRQALWLDDDAAFFSLHMGRPLAFSDAAPESFDVGRLGLDGILEHDGWGAADMGSRPETSSGRSRHDSLLFAPDNAASASDFELPNASYLPSQYLSRNDASPAGPSPAGPTSAGAAGETPLPQSPGPDVSPRAASPAGIPIPQAPFTTQGSLEVLPGAFSFYIGPTGVSDTLLLQREAYGPGGVAPATVQGLQYRQVAEGEAVHGRGGAVLFGITDHALLEKAEPKPDAAATERAWVALWQMVDTSTAWSLVQLYTRFVDPYFPIVSAYQLPADGAGLRGGGVSLALLTAMCAAALPFVVHDRSLYALLLRPPSSDQLYRLCWLGITQELHAPTLSTLQACLLLQQRLPTNLYLHDTAFSWSLMATAVSVAQTLGLHRDPAAWTGVPAWERRLRRRLWWTLWTTEKWVALARGMPSHLAPAGADDDDADVMPLGHADVAAGDTLSWNTGVVAARQPHLLYLVRLTTILADIQRTYYTLRATRRTSRHLARAVDVGRPLRARLQAWRDALPAGLRFRSRQQRLTIDSMLADSGEDERRRQPPQHLDGNASLHLSYIVTHMMLFRAMLRPLDNGADDGDGDGTDGHGDVSDNGTDSHGADVNVRNRAVTRGALLCVREFVEFVEALTPMQWNAFWHGWSRANFAMAGSFMVYLLHVVTASPGPGPGGRDDTSYDGSNAGEASSAAAGMRRARPGFGDEYRELLAWIRRWRWASRVSVSGAAGAKGLTNLMLLRVETFLVGLGELEELDSR